MASGTIADLFFAYRQGDGNARQELMARVEALLEQFVHSAMGTKLRTLEESIDLSQSVMLAFHLGAAAGKINLDSEQALKGYVHAMVTHKLANRSDKLKAAKRGGGEQPIAGEEDAEVEAQDLSASRTAHLDETKGRIQAALNAEEMDIFEGRILGRTNREIGEDLGKSADAVRMIWNRARERLLSMGILAAPGPE